MEATQQENKELIKDNEKIIQEMVQLIEKAQNAPSAGQGSVTEVIHKGDETLPAPMIARRESEAGYVYIYDTKTGEQSRANRNMLLQLLKAKRPDGTTIYTTMKPAVEVKRGSLKCMLHLDDPQRERFTDLGMPVCRKSNLTSPYMVRQHMMKRHPTAWKLLDEEKIEKERIEERALRTGLLQRMAQVQPLPEVYKCDFPGCEKEFTAKIALVGHKRSHENK